MAIDLNKAMESRNIAEEYNKTEEGKKKLVEIANKVYQGYQTDQKSREDWEKNVNNWTSMALQVATQKSYPWVKASNVKFPLLSTAAMQFAARAYPALVPSDGKVVQCKVIGKDPDGQKALRAERVSKFMSYQLIEEMEDWEEEMDKLLVILPIVGTAFKKTYWSKELQRNCSTLVLPRDLVVNYWAKTLEDAERKTETLELTKREVRERILAGTYLDVILPEPTTNSRMQNRMQPTDDKMTKMPSEADDTTPYVILEQHTWEDLDDDGYPEPYVITVEESTQTLLRITARYRQEDIIYKDDGKAIAKIKPIEYYTKYGFIPNPDGSFYDVGFGLLLGSINDTINTSINQLIDAGTLSNLQSGFLSKGLRMKLGDSKFQPGEWKLVNATGENLKNGIFPLPTKEPSATLLSLMELLLNSGKELASVADIFVGKMPGQNTPATTTMASVEQGMKLFTAVYKRVYKALTKEYKKLYKLNAIYINVQQETNILDEPIKQTDFEEGSYDVCPAADPTAFSSTQKLMKAQGLLELLQLGTVNPIEVTRRILDAQEQPNIDSLIVTQPPPNPEQQKMQMEMQLKQQDAALKEKETQQKMQLAQFLAEVKAHSQATQDSMKQQVEAMKAQTEQIVAQMEQKRLEVEHQLELLHNEQMHQQDMAHQKELNAAKVQAAKQPKGTKS